MKKILFVLAVLLFSSSYAFAEEQIPDWVKNNFNWYADEIISESELLNAIKYLIEDQVILIDFDSIDIPDRSKFAVGGPVFKSGEPLAEYTVLIYMVGSDLESRYYLGTADLEEMLKGNLNDSVNVIIETGGAKGKINDKRSIDFTKVIRHELTDDKIIEIEDLGEKNMADPAALSDFIIWGTQNYPAEKYMLVLWNHGSGVNGYGLDEINRDHLRLDDLQLALDDFKKQTNITFEVIGFDACLMATIEVANILKDYANYMVASEEFEVGYGWEYNTIINSLTEDPTQTGDKLGMVIADSFYADTIANSTPNQDLSSVTTLSVIDLSKITPLDNAMNTLTANIEKNIAEEDMPKFSISLRDSERYGIVKGKDSGQMDIKNFAQTIPKQLPDFAADAKKVIDRIDDAVIYAVKGDAKPNANGLSVYMPLNSDVVATTYRAATTSNQFYADYLERDKIAPTQNIVSDGTTISGTYSGDDIYEITVYFTTGPDESGLVKIISTDEFDPNDAEWGFTYGEINYKWDNELPSICDKNKCVPVWAEWTWGDTVSIAHIPVLIENKYGMIEADLMYDVTTVFGEKFIGAYPQQKEGVFEKNLLALENGDKIHPYIEINHWETDTLMRVPEDQHSITVDDSFFTNGFWQTYDGKYFLNVEICDYSDNCSWSDFFEFNVKGNYKFYE